MIRKMLIERHLIGTVAPLPETVTITRLIDGNPVNPGPQRGLPSESMNGAEHPKEDFLRQIERLVAVAEHVHRQLNHHSLMLSNELGTRRLLTLGTPLHEGRFATGNI